MLGISIREFSRRDGCSDTLVRKAIKSGHLSLIADGSIDPRLVGTEWRAGNRRGANATVRTDETPEDTANRIVNVEGRAPYSRPEAERIKENFLALLRELEFGEKSGRLVEAAEVEAAAFKCARQVRDNLTNLPAQASPLVAAKFGIDAGALCVELESHVRNFLSAQFAAS